MSQIFRMTYSSILGLVAIWLEKLRWVHHLPHKVDVLLCSDISLPCENIRQEVKRESECTNLVYAHRCCFDEDPSALLLSSAL